MALQVEASKVTIAKDAPRITVIPDNYLDELAIEEPEKPKKKKKLTKAEKKERRQKAAIEFKKLEIRDHLRRELELSKKSAKKGQKSWEEMCKDIKIVEMREELQEWHQKTNRQMLQTDEKITHMLNDIDVTQEMHKRNFQKYLRTIEFLQGCYKVIRECNKALYESQASELIQDFYEELNEKKEQEANTQKHNENRMHASNLVAEQQLQMDYHIYLERRDDRVNTEIEKRYKLRDSVACKMRELQKQLLLFVQSLKNTSLDVHKYERIHWLMDKQRIFLVESQKLNDLEFYSTRVYGELQRELMHIEVDAQRKLNDLRLEMEYFLQVRKSIENDMKMDREITFEKLRIMTSESHNAMQQLTKLEKYGELLLSLAANCRKLETESEKIVADKMKPLKMQEDSEQNQLFFKLKVLDLKSHVDLTEEELIKQMAHIKNFWHRQALVEMQNLLLMEDKRRLTEENNKYINFIKSMSKADDVNELQEAKTVESIMVGETPRLQMRQGYKLKSKK